MADRFSSWLDRGSLYIALLAAWIAMLGSLYFSEVAHYIPCTLCWYQRILMYPLTLLIAVGLLRRDENTPFLILPFSILGIAVSTYHVLLEKTNWFSSAATCQVGVPCTVIWINWFGFLTIPFLALIAFLIITVMSIVAWQAGEPGVEEEAETPTRVWMPVFGIIAAVIVAFVLLIQFSTQPAEAQSAFTVIETGAPMMQLDGTPIGGTEEMGTTADGERLYREVCATCHGQKGEGIAGLGNTFVGSTFIQENSEDEVVALIRSGRAATDPANKSGIPMPPSGGRPDLSDADLLAIVRFLRSENFVGDGEVQ